MWNARSVVSKVHFIQSLSIAKDIDVFCITETWLTDLIYDQEILPSNFTIYKQNRASRGGGVLIGVSNLIPARRFITNSSSQVAEHMCIELLTNPPTLICCIYIPPNLNYSKLVQDQELSFLLSLPVSHDIFLVGDLNSPDINWCSLTGSNCFSSNLCAKFFNMSLTQLVHEPTHTHSS